MYTNTPTSTYSYLLVGVLVYTLLSLVPRPRGRSETRPGNETIQLTIPFDQLVFDNDGHHVPAAGSNYLLLVNLAPLLSSLLLLLLHFVSSLQIACCLRGGGLGTGLKTSIAYYFNGPCSATLGSWFPLQYNQVEEWSFCQLACCTYIHEATHPHPHTHTHTLTHTLTHTYIHTHTYTTHITHIHTQTHIYLPTHIPHNPHTHTHTHTHPHTYTLTHPHTAAPCEEQQVPDSDEAAACNGGEESHEGVPRRPGQRGG